MTKRVETPQKIRFLKYLLEEDRPVKSSEIASKFSIRTATVTRSLRELEDAGYVRYDPYQAAVLTDTGSEVARFFYRRHRILSLMFARSGLSDLDACQQAEKIEHLVPKSTVDQICRSLGHPSRASCGVIDHDPVCCGVCI